MDTNDTIQRFANNYFAKSSCYVTDIELENHNRDYCGARFKINDYTVRFRKAKITPNKVGQFVVAWQKDRNNVNEAYPYELSPDFLIVYTEMKLKEGAFIFPKEALMKNKILSTDKQKGKMGFRVYPSWDKVESPQALKTQRWQSKYFVDFTQKDSTL